MKPNLTIIDADSIIYLVASRYKDVKIRSSALNDLDSFIMDILSTTYGKYYLGYFGKIKGAKNFRYDVAKTKPYKGTRKEKESWYLYWEKIMKNHMEKVWGFVPVEYVEADDMCTVMAEKYKKDDRFGKVYIASPDKDLAQVSGIWIYNYGKHTEEYLDEVKALTNLYGQCIEGDGADNIPGLPGCGEKAAKIFKESYNSINIKDIEEDIKDYYKEYLHNTYPEKQLKASKKSFLAGYKLSHNISRFNKKTKENALRTFNMGGKLFKPLSDVFYLTVFDEMYKLLYMLRTEEDVKKYWKEYTPKEPLEEQFIEWEIVDNNIKMIEADIVEEDFNSNDFLDTEYDEF